MRSYALRKLGSLGLGWHELMINIKRVYEKPETSDGLRVLVDRIWPRGMSKAKAKIDVWEKEIAPSTKLRRWFGHAPDRWVEFKKRYKTELADKKGQLRVLSRSSTRLTLVYSARDETRNQAVVLKEVLERLAS
jgi:uncharacterized protein YeaO (DUF488 family)